MGAQNSKDHKLVPYFDFSFSSTVYKQTTYISTLRGLCFDKNSDYLYISGDDSYVIHILMISTKQFLRKSSFSFIYTDL